ncbi:MAG: hypothetical protein RQM90_10235 [Methanoculleus sp.]
MLFDLGEWPVVVGRRGAGVHPVAVVGSVDDRGDACRGDALEV